MSKVTSGRIWSFFIAILQTSMIVGSQVCSSRGSYVGVLFVGFGISFVWTLNVKRAAFGGWLDRSIYAGGAAVGSIMGMWIARNLVP